MTQIELDRPPAGGPDDAPLRRPRRRRRRLSVTGVLGELLITAGVIVLFFLVWQQWIDDALSGGRLRDDAVAQSHQWDEETGPDGAAAPPVDPSEIPVLAPPGNAETFANLIIPRFGADYYRPIAQGIGLWDVLNRYKIGHYPTTQMPGEAGNFVVASHRRAYGGAFHYIHTLKVGDPIWVETQDGWYKYVFRNLEYVRPTEVSVLNPTPQDLTGQVTGRFISLQTCNPYFSTAERVFAFGELEQFYPRSGGAPDEIASIVKG